MVTDDDGAIDTKQARINAILARRAAGGWALADTLSDMTRRFPHMERPDALAYAAADGDVETVRQLLAAGDDPNRLGGGAVPDFAPIDQATFLFPIEEEREMKDLYETCVVLLEAGAAPSCWVPRPSRTLGRFT